MPSRSLLISAAVGLALALLAPAPSLADTTYEYQQGLGGYSGARSADISSLGGGNGTTFKDGPVDWCIGVLPAAGYSISPLLRFEELTVPLDACVVGAELEATLISYERGGRVVGHYLRVAWDEVVDVDPEANSSHPNKLGWLKRAPDLDWGGPGATAAGVDVMAGIGFSLPADGSPLSDAGAVRLTTPLAPAIVERWIREPALNFGVVLTVDVVGHHVGYAQPQRHASGSTPRPLEERPLLRVIVGDPVRPASVGNTLRAVSLAGDLVLSWAPEPAARGYRIYRSELAGSWPALPHRDGLSAPEARFPDAPAAGGLLLYRASGLGCAGLEGD